MILFPSRNTPSSVLSSVFLTKKMEGGLCSFTSPVIHSIQSTHLVLFFFPPLVIIIFGGQPTIVTVSLFPLFTWVGLFENSPRCDYRFTNIQNEKSNANVWCVRPGLHQRITTRRLVIARNPNKEWPAKDSLAAGLFIHSGQTTWRSTPANEDCLRPFLTNEVGSFIKGFFFTLSFSCRS